jgi:hypothetical protein
MSEVSTLLNLTNDPTNANEKLEALKLAILHLKKVDTEGDNTLLQRSTSFIVSTFSTAITISGFTLMPPVVGGALISACVVSAGGALITLAHDIFTERESSEKARILRAVLASHDLTKWAKLWSLTDTSTFLLALEYACQGQLETVDGQDVFHHADRKHPFAVAHAWVTSTQPQDVNEPTLMIPQVVEPTTTATVTPTLPQVVEPMPTPEPQRETLTSSNAPITQPPDINELRQLPLEERAIALLDALSDSGFDVARAIADQITCICGNQRGGKGTLMAILATLACAVDPKTKVHYFTAGDDIYPFRCDKLYCRLTYPNDDGETADAKVASALYEYLKTMDNGTQGSYNDIILVIDEAVALSDYLDSDQKQWMIRFLLTRASKKGAQIFIVLHGVNLTSWVGTGNAGGFSSTFKSGATFIGCEATSKRINPLRVISVATGRYFIASPDDFSKSVANGDLGTVPEWLKVEVNPSTNQPDPARSILNFFPELRSGEQVNVLLTTKSNNPSSLSVETPALTDNVPVTDLKVSDSLIDPLKTIWLYAKEKNEWVTAKEIYQKSYACLKRKGVKEIRQYLGLLADTGYGEIDEEGKSDSSVAFRAY